MKLRKRPREGLNEWLTELRLFPDWYVPAVGLDPIDLEGWDAAWNEVLEPVDREVFRRELRYFEALDAKPET